jgi:Domain of unknown function (DUF4062)
MKTFLSSTYVDLVNHRKAAAEAVERLGHQVGHMEVFGARPEEPTNACFREIDECDLFLGIYGHRYGYVPDGSHVSITEAEFDYAQKNSKPVFCFLVDGDHPWPPKMIESEPGRSKLSSFKARIGSRLVRDTFTTPDDLAYKVATALGRYLSTLDNAGTVTLPHPTMRHEEFFDKVLSEISSLRNELQGQKKLMTKVDHIYGILTFPSSTDNIRRGNTLPSIFNGSWIDLVSNTALYPRLVNGEIIVPYCYGGDSHLTGVFFDFRQKSERVFFARFKWIEDEIQGFAYIQLSSLNNATGGWWFSEDMPKKALEDWKRVNLKLPRMNEMTLSRRSQRKLPKWVDVFFRESENTLLSQLYADA